MHYMLYHNQHPHTCIATENLLSDHHVIQSGSLRGSLSTTTKKTKSKDARLTALATKYTIIVVVVAFWLAKKKTKAIEN